MYPTMATEHPTNMTGPRTLNLSDAHVPKRTAKKPAMLGGTVKSWAVIRVYPRPEMMVGRKREKE